MNVLSTVILLLSILIFAPPVYGIVDPLSSPNNKFGIHIITPSIDEASPAATLVNSSGGDWGYITVLVESKNRDQESWQKFFDHLRRLHLIPLVRLATEPQGGYWKRPYEGEEIAWADFLDNLNWPTKNRYVIIYNEPNHAKEWGGAVDPKDYALTLDKTINALKNKSSDFFVLNAGFDASAPQKAPNYSDELTFMRAMDEAVPGIFNKLDGWVSHSYPNPGFVGSPNDSGRGSVRSWFWELQQLKGLDISKNLPVFITETGWKHAEGLSYDPSLPSTETVGEYFKEAFQTAWSSNSVVAVTPFLLNYQQSPFDHFSFKKITGEGQDTKILGTEFPDYHPQYQAVKNLPKLAGRPVQEDKAELIKGEIFSTFVSGQSYIIPLAFRNTGQSIWNEYETVKLVPSLGKEVLGIEAVSLPKEVKVEPGKEYTFYLPMKVPTKDQNEIKVSLNLFRGNTQFVSQALEATTEIKSPVSLKIKSTLRWKENSSGDYILTVVGPLGNIIQSVTLSEDGLSNELEAKYLLPNYEFEFILEKPFYKRSVIKQKVVSGANILDFGALEPDLLSALLNPIEFWKLLPLSS